MEERIEMMPVTHTALSVRLPVGLVRRVVELARARVWSRNRAVEQALERGLSALEKEARRG